MDQLGKILIFFGLLLVAVGGLLLLAGRFGLPLGRLPGDIRIEGENFTCIFPLATSIILSILLTAALSLAARLLNR